MVELHCVQEYLHVRAIECILIVQQSCNPKLGYYICVSESTLRLRELIDRYIPTGSHECVVLKYLFMMFDASSFKISSASGQTSRHSSVLGNATSKPLVATESRKHVASSEDSLDGTFEINEPKDTSDRKGKEAGVSVRLWIFSVRGSASDVVGVDGLEE